MAKQKNAGWKFSTSEDPGDEIVISGVAGRFPKSDNVKEFAENLYNKQKLTVINHTRYDARKQNLPTALGVLNNIEKFDNLFFGVSCKQAELMDVMSRMLLEHTYEALLDAGINPQSLRGKNTGVFIGCCFSDTEKYKHDENETGLGLVGCCRSIFANRISFFLDISGPSLSVDTACSSSLTALDIAYRSIKNGECDSAIVGGCNTCTEISITEMFNRLGVLTMGDACYCFDNRASGYVRSEAAGVVILQKAKDAKRIYGTIVHAKSNNDGYKTVGLTYPSNVMQYKLLKETYGEGGVPLSEVAFLEAHATATKVGDPQELTALDNFFFPERTKPLKIGSVKSNVGHAEGASGLCSLVKVLITMDNGLIPPNINYEVPRMEFDCIKKQRLQVVTETTPLEEGYIGISSYGFGGSNVHVILKPNPKKKCDQHPVKNNLPKLVVASGRTEEAVASFLDDVGNRPVDVEYIRLLHDVFADDIAGHFYRGYTIIHPETNESLIRTIEKHEGDAKPVWFIFSGMGSQWPGMGVSLMRFPAFAQAIQKCDSVLKPRGLDIIDILTNIDEHNFDNILRSFVGITAIQIGLVDILTTVGIVPDKIIGHSVGELACSYADGCFTAEETILAAYSRGLASIETKLINGSMAAVGLGYNQIKNLCPNDIEVACHNGPDSCTISGPKKSMETFVGQLQAKGVFAKEVPTSNIAYHSKYIAPAGDKLLKYLRDVIKDPKTRSKKWLSTSVPRNEWSSPTWKLSSAEYHTNNLLSPVLFEETAALIPKNAITVEISPHGLLQAILKRSLDPSVLNISLARRGHRDNAVMLLEALGKLYNVGLQPQLAKLYPKVELPVSCGTPMISPLVKWDHSDNWDLWYNKDETSSIIVKTVNVSLSGNFGKSMIGHVIDGRHIVPATAYLTLIWDVYNAETDKNTEFIVFEDVMFNRATIITDKRNLQFIVVIEESTGSFQIIESNETIVTGIVRFSGKSLNEQIPAEYLPEANEMPEEMNTKDIYKEFRLRGYHYSGMFRGIKSATVTGIKGHVEWKNNWVSFLDTIIQMQILRFKYRELLVPTRIKEFVIDVRKHEKALQETTDGSLPVICYEKLRSVMCGGVLIRNIAVTGIPRRVPSGVPVLEEYKFVAYRDLSEVTLPEAISLSMHLALENIHSMNIQTVEFVDERDNLKTENLVSPLIVEVLHNIPMLQTTSLLISSSNQFQENSLPASIKVLQLKEIPPNTRAAIAFGRDLLSRDRMNNLKLLTQLLVQGGFLVSVENENYSEQYAENFELDIIMEKRVNRSRIVMLKKRVLSPTKILTIFLNNNEFSWIEDVKNVLKIQEKNDSAEKHRVVLVGEGFENGLLGFLNCLRREPGGEAVTGILIQDTNAPKFSLDDPFYRDQLKLDLAVNVLQRNVWGSYRHLPLPPIEPKLVPYGMVIQKQRGDLKSFSWIEGPFEEISLENEFVYVHYSALNFRDVMVTTAKMQNVITDIEEARELLFGCEYSGIDTAGNRVMGLSAKSTFANLFWKNKEFMFSVPDKWTLEEAATIPCAYSTCYFAFYVVGQIQRNHKVLIHSGSGAVGQAAINLALHEGCEIFTTVGTPEKREFIKRTFPAIDDDHIGNSRDTSFELMVLKQTQGRGVDIVLNSLAAEKLQASVRCLAINGQFIEIGKFDIISNNKLEMSDFLRGISFRTVMLDSLLQKPDDEQHYKWSQTLRKLLLNGIDKGVVKPLVRTVFDKDQVETAFRYMAAGKHIGKVMLKNRNEEDPMDTPILAYPQYYCQRDGVYVIFGGLGGVGLELADWLILRGAKYLVLVSRTGVKNGYQRMRINLWESQGIKVSVVAGKDVSNRKDVESILKIAEKLGPINGIFNLAVSLKDAICANQTIENFEESFKSKAWLTKILDELTRKMCPHLRHFVVFSSVSCGRGNPGQTNYGMSNSVMERICEKRVQDGLPGLALEWGAIGDVGLVADMQVDGKELVIGGTLQQGIVSCLQVLNDFLQRDCAIVSSMVVAEKLARVNANSVVEAVQSIMGLKDLKRINMMTTLPELGVDSMTVVEIKETLEREFDLFLSAQQIRTLNFAKLTDMSKSTEKLADTCKSTEKLADTNKSTEKLPDTSKSTEKFADMVKSTEKIVDMIKSTEKYKGGLKDKPNKVSRMTNVDYFGKMIGSNELYSQVYVELPTKADTNLNRIYMIPGIEGVRVVFNALAKHLKPPATCLQVDLSIERKCHESVVETANSLVPYILSTNKGRKDFVIVGYSFGCLIAIEIARKVESMGLCPRLILIDGSPDQLKLMNSSIFTDDEEQNQNRFVIASLNNIFSTQDLMLEKKLQECTTWEKKMDLVEDIFRAAKQDKRVSIEYSKDVYDIFYRRSLASQNYYASNEEPIKSPIILLRQAQTNFPSLEEDYGLSKVTEGRVTLHYLEGDHLTIMDNIMIAHVINDEATDCTKI